MGTIANYLDGVIPMGYTTNPPTIGWTTNPEPISGGGKAPHTTTRDIATTIAHYSKAMGGRNEKLYLGISLAFGGYEWRCQSDLPLSPVLDRGVWRSLEECERAGKPTGSAGTRRSSCPGTYRDGDVFVQGWYNDPVTWQARLDWVKEQGLGGVGIWVLDGVNDPPGTLGVAEEVSLSNVGFR